MYFLLLVIIDILTFTFIFLLFLWIPHVRPLCYTHENSLRLVCVSCFHSYTLLSIRFYTPKKSGISRKIGFFKVKSPVILDLSHILTQFFRIKSKIIDFIYVISWVTVVIKFKKIYIFEVQIVTKFVFWNNCLLSLLEKMTYKTFDFVTSARILQSPFI